MYTRRGRAVVIVITGIALIAVAIGSASWWIFSQGKDTDSGSATAALVQTDDALFTDSVWNGEQGEPAKRPGEESTSEDEALPFRVGGYERNVYQEDRVKRGDTQGEHDGGPQLDSGSEFDMTKVFIYSHINLDDLSIDEKDIWGGAAFDSIPALTQPKRESIAAFNALSDDARVVVVSSSDGGSEGTGKSDGSGATVVVYPIGILNYHEVINDTIGDDPVAVTYCPLCDSAMVFSRRIMRRDKDGELVERDMNFGVSGLVLNSNMLLYDKTDRGLWSQLLMECISGPNVGTTLDTWPFTMSTIGEVRAEYPNAEIVSVATGHRRNYALNPYADYFRNPKGLLYPPRFFGDELPSKTLGVGVYDRKKNRAWFAARDHIGSAGLTITTSQGDVKVEAGPSGISILEKPADIQALQTFYYAWSAFHPDVEIVGGE